MASKKKIKRHSPGTTEVKKKGERQTTDRPKSRQRRSDELRWMIPTILAITFVAFIPVLNAGFVSWDDGEYVLQNTALTNADLKTVLTTPMQGNVHPLTMLSLFINYLVSGE